MKKYYFTLVSVLIIVLVSCSEDSKTEGNLVLRPTVPITAAEVQIGNQKWMTKNLNVDHYRNGDLIPQVTDPDQWRFMTTGAWCYYANNTGNETVYGKLYNWYAVVDPRGLAPNGWHVPTQPELETLTTYLGGMTAAGGKLKSTAGWQGTNTGATNSSGFTGLPGGNRWYDNFGAGGFANIGTVGDFWTCTANGSAFGYGLHLVEYSGSAYTTNNYYNKGCSVRCVKN